MGAWTKDSLVPLLEAIFFASSRPLSIKELSRIVGDVSSGLLKEALLALILKYEKEDRGIELVEVAGGFRFQTRPKYKKWIKRALRASPARLSRASLETLAIIAYKQPVTRAEIESIRGVDTSAILRQLLAKNLIKISGRKDVPGRPLLYATTRYFLELFQLKDLDSLPQMEDEEVSPRPYPLFRASA